MINISFANPLVLLVLIPMLALVLVPYFIAIRKENKSKSAVISLALHIVIILLAVLAAAGMSNVTVITETEVYVLADVSHSTHEKLDLIDEYIEEVKDELPRNSDMGVITFGKDYELHTPLGKRVKSVKENNVNDSATDIVSALRYASTLFSDSAIKRIVLITDGMSTDSQAGSELIRLISDLKSDGVYIDVIYIDSNLAADVKEVQLSGVEFNESVYLDHETYANLLVESSCDCNAIITLNKNGEKYMEKAVEVTKGYNIVNFELDTSSESVNDYEITISSPVDTSMLNNNMKLTQKVNGSIKVLLVTSQSTDEAFVRNVYGSNAEIDVRVKPKDPKPGAKDQTPVPFDVPCTVEELCKYDEIVLSNVDVTTIVNADTFINSLDTVVSMYGKSLVTVGNNNIQNNDNELIKKLENMLPVRYGNNDADPKLYTILIDSSRSMEFQNADFFVMAKLSATYLLGLLNENDYFAIMHFSGEVYPLVAPRIASAENISAALADIARLDVTQGTMIGSALKAAGEMMIPMSFSEKQIILVSDGMSYEGGEVIQDNPIKEAANLKANNITVSALNAGNKDGEDNLESIAFMGGGEYYFCASSDDLPSLVLGEVADDVTDTEILGDIPVNVKRENDKVLAGIGHIPNINGYLYTKSKASAETVLTATYKKSGGGTIEAPIYAYWSYGNGKISTLTTQIGGDWVAAWEDGDGHKFLENIASTNIPNTRIDSPYSVSVEFDGKYSNIEIIPAFINPDASMNVTFTFPDGRLVTQKLTFDSYRYFYRVETGEVGKYIVDISYDWATKSYTSQIVHTISYSPEYDSFVTYSPAAIYAFMRNNGNVFENEDIKLEIDEGKIATYVLDFTVPFLILAAALFVIDTIIRKLKWADIVSLFKRTRRETK